MSARILRIVTLVAALLLLASPAAVAATSVTVIGSPPDVAFGTFSGSQVAGYSRFVDTGDTVAVYGYYKHLDKRRAYFTVAYANSICDPAQALPVGPFVTDRKGRARLAAQVPGAIDVGKTRSISVRIGDTAKDLDGDGLTGPTDVVAVPGRPKVGLVRCDQSIYTVDR